MIYFFTKGGRRSGMGHVARLLPLYDEFSKLFFPTKFIISGDKSVNQILVGREYEIVSWRNILFKDITEADIVLIDTIKLPVNFILKINYLTKNIYFISDRFYKNKISVDCDLINWAVGSLKIKKVNKGIYGERFVPLRQEIMQYRKVKRQIKIPKVVISMGSADLLNILTHFLEIYARNHAKKFKLNVIIRSYHKNFEVLVKKYNDIAKFFVDVDTQKLFEVIYSSDFGIASGGHSIYEYSYIGTPVIHVLTAKNQIPAASWNNTGFTYPLGWYNKKTFEEKVSNGINYFMNVNNIYCASNNGHKIIDGKGASRLVTNIIKECKIN